MTREERRALLGDDVITAIHERVAVAPDLTPELVEKLRRLWQRSDDLVPAFRPTEGSRAAA